MRLRSSSALLSGLASAIVLGCASSGTSSAPAASGSPPAAARDLVTPASVRALLEPLAHDTMEGRAMWTRGMERAARMIAAEMQKIELEPAGDSGFFQRIPGAARPATAPTSGRGGRGGVAPLNAIAGWDTIPADRRRTAVNVIGVLRPAQRTPSADSIVLVGAHFDHLPPRASGGVAGADTIYNGADDDASGVVAVLEIARALKAGPPPKRTIVFVAFTGEEIGFIGTNWYIAHPFVPLNRMVADFQVEMIGRPDSLAGGFGRAWLTGYERSTMGDMLKAGGIPIGPDMRPSQGFFSRSDNYAFARAGIPAHTLSSFNLHREYHTVDDETSLVNYDHMAAVINAAVRAVRILADGPAPTWHPGGQPAPGRRGGPPPSSPRQDRPRLR